MRILTPLLLAVVVATPLVEAQTVRVNPQGRVENMNRIKPRNGISAQDRQFMMDAAASNMFEIESSELALQRAQSAWAKQFARDMITDHKAAQAELMTLARQKRVTLPERLPSKHRSMIDRLSRLNGEAFDAQYRAMQIQGHQETARKMETQIKRGNDSMVRNYAVKMLPAVKMHLKHAQQRTTMTQRQSPR